MIPTMTIYQLNEQMADQKVMLVDVRQPAEYHSEHIQGAYLLPLAHVSEATLPMTPKPIVFYCRSGQRSAQAASQIIAAHSSRDVYSLEGGISAWIQQGHFVVRQRSPMIPVDRQTQLTIGSLILIGLLLGAVWSPLGYVLPVAMGVGLLIAGATGWCGMARWLASMPWNQ